MSVQTPFQQDYPVGKMLQVTVPDVVTYTDGKEYTFLQWEDGSQNTTRNVSVTSIMALTATYVTQGQAGFPWWSIPIVIGVAYFALKSTKKS